MKILKLCTVYEAYLKGFYAKQPELLEKDTPYARQQEALFYDGFGQADYWSHAMAPLGYDMWEVTVNAEPMQRAWAREHGITSADTINLKEIVLSQVKHFKPDILWYFYYDQDLMQQIRADIPGIRLVLGWIGSAIYTTEAWRHIDLILSCAPEAAIRLRQAGYNAKHLNHGFDPRVNTRLQATVNPIELSFIGQIVRESEFHLEREHILEQLRSKVDVKIFSPSAEVTAKDSLSTGFKQLVYDGINLLHKTGIPKATLRKIPVMGKAASWPRRPLAPVNPKLKPFINPAVFGLDMFQVLRDSKITLNIHADSSPTHASNLRLWEATGVGTCLVTDWKENIHELFEPEKEVVTYKSVDECVTKVKWLIEHPAERQAIAKAGQARTLREHTFGQRAVLLDEIIREQLGEA